MQKKFLDSRFGSVFIPIEIEFEWFKANPINLNIELKDDDEYLSDINFCLGIIKSYKILPQDTKLHFKDNIAEWEEDVFDKTLNKYIAKTMSIPYSVIFTPLPNTALAITKTKLLDYFVNVRDKPDSKDGKIVAQLFSQSLRLGVRDKDGVYHSLYTHEDVKQAEAMWIKDKNDIYANMQDDDLILYYNSKTQEPYYQAKKATMIKPLWIDEYIVFIWEILPNNWCKVSVFKAPPYKPYEQDNEYANHPIHGQWVKFATPSNKDYKSYLDKFYNAISTISIIEGYIHSSALEYLAPFPRD